MTDDVHPYEVMKIRLLNAGHSSLGYLGYLAGLKYIFEITQDPEFQRYTRGMMDEEVTPLLKPVPGVNLEDYKQTLIERFSNPIIKDQATRICMDGSNKMPKFILPSIRESLQRGGSISKLTLCVAAWFRFLQGTDEHGAAIPLDDPMGATLRELAVKGGKDPAALLSLHEIFGDLSNNQRFVTELGKALESLYNNGARATLRAFIQ
jgi:mannitol 2-dehydrogenase